MSTTFDVYPLLKVIPSYQAIIEIAQYRLHQFLSVYSIELKPTIGLSLRKEETHDEIALDIQKPAQWDTYYYAWFYIHGVAGGCDAYFCEVNDLEREYWEEEIQRKEYIENCLQNGYYWMFRRSVGQPAIINLTYGIIAGALAQLTNGLINSLDSAWDYQRFPATAEEFYSWYFHPDKAMNPEKREWAERCIELIDSELRIYTSCSEA